MDGVLIKGSDGGWYVMKDGKLTSYDPVIEEISQDDPADDLMTETDPLGMQVPLQPIAPAVFVSVKPNAVSVLDVVKQPEIIAPKAPRQNSGQAKVALLAPNTIEKPVASAPRMDASDDMEIVIAKAVTHAKLNFPDPSLTKRFKLLVASRLREVRRAEDVVALLARETKVGGLGLGEDDAHRALGIIETAFTEFHKKWERVEAERKAAVIKAREEAAKKVQKIMANEQLPISNDVVKEKKETKPVKTESKVEPFQKTTAARFAPQVSKPQKGVRVAMMQPGTAPAKGIASIAAKKPTARISASSAPAVTDIRKPKLFGPADELREMRLIDFRRMGTPVEAVNRIKAKIELMGSESLAKRREAQTAWRQSEVYRVYTDMMGSAMARGKAIDAEVSERARSGGASLTIDEIDAVMGLSDQLRG